MKKATRTSNASTVNESQTADHRPLTAAGGNASGHPLTVEAAGQTFEAVSAPQPMVLLAREPVAREVVLKLIEGVKLL